MKKSDISALISTIFIAVCFIFLATTDISEDIAFSIIYTLAVAGYAITTYLDLRDYGLNKYTSAELFFAIGGIVIAILVWIRMLG